MPRLSVIVLNYDGRQWLPACLDALASQRDAPESETLLIDNGSSDGSAHMVSMSYPAVRVIETGANLAFAEGNNVGARAALGDIVTPAQAPEPPAPAEPELAPVVSLAAQRARRAGHPSAGGRSDAPVNARS